MQPRLLNISRRPVGKPALQKKIFSWLLLFCILQPQLLVGQNTTPLFELLPQGLPNNSVKCMLRDSKGYMWFGTTDGLARYDGVNFYIYENNPDDKNSISHNSINAIAEDASGNIWVGTSAGMDLYDREQNNFINFNNIPGNNLRLYNGYISAICADRESRLWIGTLGSGLALYDTKKQTLRYFTNDPKEKTSISSSDITHIKTDPSNNIWVGTRNGLNLFLSNNTFRAFYSDPRNPSTLSNNYITALTADCDGNVWAGTRDGLNKIKKDGDAVTFERHNHDSKKNSGLSNTSILSLAADKEGFLWIGTENGGLNRLHLDDRSITHYYNEEFNPHSISSNSIWSLYADEEDILWIGVYSKGINILNKKSRKFDLHERNAFLANSLPDNDVRGFAEDREGNIWIATDGGGVCMFNAKTRQVTKVVNTRSATGRLTSNAVMAILCDSKDNVWVGSWSGGVDRLSKQGARVRNYNLTGENQAGVKQVISLYEDRSGNIWAGSSGSGLFLYDPETDRFIQFTTDNALAPATKAYVTSMLEDKDGTLWVSTLYGLVSMKRIQGQQYEGHVIYRTNEPGSISSNDIEVVFQDSKHRLWFGSVYNGLNRLNSDGTFTTYQKGNGFPSNSIKAIAEDKSGMLWVSTNKGLTRFDPGTGTVRNFDTGDGLNSNEFYARACLQSRSGEFYFGGKNGFNTFYPENLKANTFIPPVYITDLKINGRSVPIGAKDSPLKKHVSATSAITLSHEQTSFIIDFVALNYTHPTRNKYVYKLEGFDTHWNDAGNNLTATYTNIDPGTYTFLVKGSNNDGVWSEKPASLVITIDPPIWKTWWAELSYVVILSLLAWLLFKIRSERIKVKNQLKLERLAREKEHELTQLKMQFFTNISHEFRTPLSLIMAPLENLINTSDPKIREQLSVTHRAARRMVRLVNELMDFRKLEESQVKLKVEETEVVGFISSLAGSFTEMAKSRNIHFSTEQSVDACRGWIDKNKIETMLSNLLGNAFKFVNDEGKITLSINLLNDPASGNNTLLELIVTDNGIGIGATELPFIFEKFYQAKSADIKNISGTGIGLALTKGLVELHHGTIAAQSIPNQETRFTLRLPIDRHAYSEDELLPVHLIESEPEIVYEKTSDVAEEKSIDNSEHAQILVVEDNNELRSYLVNELSKNFNVTAVANGAKGVEVAREKVPDLIVSDIVMPEKNGIELCSTLKSDLRTSHIPIILLTAKTTVEDQIEGIGTGADAYSLKPFNIRLLKAQIRQLIESRRKLHAIFSQDVYMLPAQMAGNDLDRDFLQKAVDYVIQNITYSQLNVEALADVFRMSKSQVYRKIKALTGKSAVEFIRTVRLKQALKLMATKKYTLAEIAYQTGFTSPSYFTKSFKEQYGKAPSEFLECNTHYQQNSA